MKSTRLFTLFACLLVALPAAAQSVAVQAAPASFVESAAPDYQMGPGDLLSIKVSGVTEFDQVTRVSNSGRIRVPHVGTVFVYGMSTIQLEKEIATLITKHELVNEPSVRVQIDEYRAAPTYVIGEVTTPGQFVITGDMYLLDLLSKGGGLLASAGKTGYLYRRRPVNAGVEARLVDTPPEGSSVPAAPPSDPAAQAAPAPGAHEEVIEIDFATLRVGTRPELNVKLRGGDVLYVPRRQADNVYIIGDVRNPGVYTLPRSGKMTAATALIFAGGPMPTAKTKSAFIMRKDEAGNQLSVPFDFAAIIRGDQTDVDIKTNDIIFLPASEAKTIALGLLNLLPRLLQQFVIF